MKKLLKYSIIFLIVYSPLFGMEKQPPTKPIQHECDCGRKVQLHRLRNHIYAHHFILALNKKQYLCPKRDCRSNPFSNAPKLITHLEINHGLSLQEPPKTLTNEQDELTTGTNLLSATNNHETTLSKTPCTCGKKWPKYTKARISHIKKHHHSCIHFQNTYHCIHTHCYFTASAPEFVVEHQSTHNANVEPIKKIEKKYKRKQKKEQNIIPILPKIDQLPFTPVAESQSVSNNHHNSTDSFLTFQTEELEELFPIWHDPIIEN